MKTDDLATLLATGVDGVEPDAMARRYATAIGWGAFGSTLLMAILLGVRDDLSHAALQPMFWAKLGYVISLAMASLFVLSRLARPGMSMAGVSPALAAPLILIWALAVIALIGTSPTERESLLFGTYVEFLPLPYRHTVRAGLRRSHVGDEGTRADRGWDSPAERSVSFRERSAQLRIRCTAGKWVRRFWPRGTC